MACGARTDMSGEPIAEGDASTDAKPPKKDAALDVGPDVYVPVGTKCVRGDASAPLAWKPDDAGVPLRPPLVVSSGGPVLPLPTFIPITFDGYEYRDQVEDFVASIGCTTYWRDVTSDYGVGIGVSGPPVHLSETPPTNIDDQQIGTWLRNKILQKTVPDAVQDETLYVIYYPSTTTITLQGETSCQSFGGYHNEVSLSDGRKVPYAVMPDCGSFGQLVGIDALTGTTSHELVEAVTDPEPMSNAAYQLPEPLYLAWALAGGGEVADLCTFNDDAFFLPSDYPFYVEHSWVNHSDWLGQNPCQPTSDVYFASAPILPDLIPYDIGLGPQNAAGVKIALNSSKTIDVKLIAGGSWSGTIAVDVFDGSQFLNQGKKLNFNLSPSTGQVGDTLKLTINRTGTNQTFGMEPFMLRAHSAGQSSSWWGVVGDP